MIIDHVNERYRPLRHPDDTLSGALKQPPVLAGSPVYFPRLMSAGTERCRMFDEILVPIDGSDCADLAVDYAADIARRYEAIVRAC